MPNPYYAPYWSDISLNELEHHGILGMKWGIRRYQNPDGTLTDAGRKRYFVGNKDQNYAKKYGIKRTKEQRSYHQIPKGVKVYRVSTSSNTDITGSTYVSYLPPDRDLYRGSYSNVLKKHQGGKENERMQETEYELTTDLNIPSRDELRKAYQVAMSDTKVKAAASKALAEKLVKSDEIDYWFNYGDEAPKIMRQEIKKFTNEYFEQFGSYTPDQAFALTARSLGSASPIVKKAVIDQLSAKGYNAMVDEGGVGGIVSPREGVEPLIIFNGKTSMKETGKNVIDDKTIAEADKRHREWQRVAWQNKYKPW